MIELNPDFNPPRSKPPAAPHLLGLANPFRTPPRDILFTWPSCFVRAIPCLYISLVIWPVTYKRLSSAFVIAFAFASAWISWIRIWFLYWRICFSTGVIFSPRKSLSSASFAIFPLEFSILFPMPPSSVLTPRIRAGPANAATIAGPNTWICCTRLVTTSSMPLKVPPITFLPLAKSASMISHASFSLLYRPSKVSLRTCCIL